MEHNEKQESCNYLVKITADVLNIRNGAGTDTAKVCGGDDMDYKSLMIKSLSELLLEGETLNHPIYGILEQGNKQHYGYFGFTEKFLLIALVRGKKITYTTRIPLDIKSIRIKKTLITESYKIEIAFNEGAPCKITAASKVLMIDCQKNNLPRFLEYLQHKSPQRQAAKLKEIDGEKIRWQYFNVFIYMMLSYFPMLLIIVILTGLKEQSFDMNEIIDVLLISLEIWSIVLLPFVLLSLLNRFFFGKIVSVFNETGMYLDNHHIAWHHIQRVVYNPRIWSRFRMRFSYATISVKTQGESEYDIDVMHFPVYGLRKIKKYNPMIESRFGKKSWFTIGSMALLPSIIALLGVMFWFSTDNDISDSVDSNMVIQEEENVEFTPTYLPEEYFDTSIYVDPYSKEDLEYLFHEPLRETGKSYPLIIFLHGQGDSVDKYHLGTAEPFAEAIINLENQDEKYSSYVVIPSTPKSYEGWWSNNQVDALKNLIYHLKNNYNIDFNRIYITGISMGGFTTCRLVDEMEPNTFAAAVPLSGSSNMTNPKELHSTAFRIYHSKNDSVVDVSTSESLYSQLVIADHPNVRYIEFEDGTHISPLRSVYTYGRDEFFDWLFEQKIE